MDSQTLQIFRESLTVNNIFVAGNILNEHSAVLYDICNFYAQLYDSGSREMITWLFDNATVKQFLRTNFTLGLSVFHMAAQNVDIALIKQMMKHKIVTVDENDVVMYSNRVRAAVQAHT